MDLHAPNPMHGASGPDDVWSTVNTRENYAGVMSPLAASLWLPVCDRAVAGSFADIGAVPADGILAEAARDPRCSAVFYGRYTAGISYFRRVLQVMPGNSGASFEEQYFASSNLAPAARSRHRYPAVVLKAPAAVAGLRRRFDATEARTDAWWRYATTAEAAARPAMPQLREAVSRLEEVMRVHMVVCFVAQGVFDGLGRLAASVDKPGLHLQLATGFGQMAELELVALLDRVAHGEATMAEFLAEYGFRCAGEIELSQPTWREKPELIEKLAAKYRGAERPDSAGQARQRAAVREAAERDLLDALPRAKRPGAQLLLRLARTFIPMREEGKAMLAKGFDGTRVAVRARGRELVAMGLIDVEEDVFYLSYDEIASRLPADARAVVAERRALRAEYEKFDLPDHWTGQPDPVYAVELVERADSVVGTPAAHGVVEGYARVLASADECDDLESGEILVCHTTDPSWASAFHLAAAAVIDVGSISSHGAIVAREMGLPCVIGTGNGTSALRTGDLLRVDGAAGTVTVLKPAD
ncbi:MAG: PEP-utilizing enzyme [Sporichthyaceae bacterium]